MRATVVGSINMDIIVEVERLPRVGETLSGSNAVLAHGGKGGNQAVAIARLGGQSSLVGKVGADAFGTQIRQGLESAGVDTLFVGSAPGTATGIAMILLVKGDNTIIVSPGANHEVGREDILGASAVIQESQALLTQLEIPMDSVAFAMQTARRLGVTTILDAGPAQECPPEFLPSDRVDVADPTRPIARSEQATVPIAAVMDGRGNTRVIRQGDTTIVEEKGEPR